MSLPEKDSATASMPAGRPPSDAVETSLGQCAFCDELLAGDRTPLLKACRHEADICQECFNLWVSEELAVRRRWDHLMCPSSGCETLLALEDFQPYVTAEVFELYHQRAFEAVTQDGSRHFACFSATCYHCHFHDDGRQGEEIWFCQNPACDTRNCTLHRGPYLPFHAGKTCAQYEQRKASLGRIKTDEMRDKEREESFKANRARERKSCPFCWNPKIGRWKERDGNCKQCNACGHKFCYTCYAPYDGKDSIEDIGKKAHAPSCAYRL
ncbi:hypothetical protein E8E13_009492 [Curvularia kusanoi]|uniref:RING-type domain-containing protein n=1 Tax=Curvularia kusanoi TaxID=90978 RepID=A0A9P4TNE8_CURKU|nr:hypothetical protein E8E13_009492 [Curvularia kusanoi]